MGKLRSAFDEATRLIRASRIDPKEEVTTAASVGQGPDVALGQRPSTAVHRKRKCPHCGKDLD